MKIEELRRKIAQRVGEAMGMASVCWEPKPIGIFDSTQASKAVDHIMKYTDALLDVAEAAQSMGNHTFVCEVIIMEPPGACDCGFDNLRGVLQKLEEIK